MSITTSIPTATDNPDPDLLGNNLVAINTTSGTGLASSTDGSGFDSASGRWRSFQAIGGSPISLDLKTDYSYSGSVSGISSNNGFTVQYTLDGGSNWVTWFQVVHTNASNNATLTKNLSLSQVISNVRIRIQVDATTSSEFTFASMSGSLSNIRIEATFTDVNSNTGSAGVCI